MIISHSLADKILGEVPYAIFKKYHKKLSDNLFNSSFDWRQATADISEVQKLLSIDNP